MKRQTRTRPPTPGQRLRGQAMVFVLVMLTVVLIGLTSLYQTGLTVGKRIELQNAADAAAYSTSVVEARDLNLMAYINKALIANEVAVGQLIGLVSWTTYWKSYAFYLDIYGTALDAVTFGGTSPITKPIANAFRTTGNVAGNVLSPVASAGSTFLHVVNRVLSIAQQAFHVSSVAYAVAQYQDAIANNAPGAQVSPYGWLQLAAHTVSYGSIPNPFGDFTRTHPGINFGGGNSEADADTEDSGVDDGWAQLAALIRASRDPFSNYRGWTIWLIPPGGSGPLEVHTSDSFGIDLGLAEVGVDVYFDFEFGINIQRRGGSELRYVGSSPKAADFNWSGGDNSGMGVHLAIGGRADGYVDPIIGDKKTFNIAALDVSLADGRANLTLTVAGFDIPILDDVPAPTVAPFSGGGAQIGKKYIPATDVINSGDDFYGGAPTNRLSWLSCTVASMQGTRLSGYNGLPWYVDTTQDDPPTSFTAPFLIVGLTYDKALIENDNPGFSPYNFSNLGRLGTAPIDDAGGDVLSAIARSEVYFKRPNDVSHFARADGQEESGNAFNPYWQARLRDTGYFDRLVALLVQQQEDFTELGAALGALPSLPNPQDVLSNLMNVF